jgi:drug/metabolite transporter (DMT)-like permease
MLFLTALIWGLAFVAQDVAMDSLEPFTFNGARMVLAGVALLPVIFWRSRKKPSGQSDAPPVRQSLKVLLSSGFWCGLMLFLGSGFQQLGIEQTSAGKAGFVTALYIVLVPLAGLVWGKRVGRNVWLAVAVCVVGLFLLCVTESLQIGQGDIYLLLCAFSFTGHILVIDHFSRQVDCVRMSCIQFFVCAGLSLAMAALCEQPTWAGLQRGLVPIVYAGVMSGAVGYTLQILGQRDTDPTVASLILCLESVFAVLAGWVILGEGLGTRGLAGCGLMFAGILLAQWPKRRVG